MSNPTDIPTPRTDLIEKTICELREALRTCSQIKSQSSLQQWFDADKVCAALSLTPSEISEKWVKREVLEKCADTLASIGAQGCLHKHTEESLLEALTLARTELGKEKA